MAFDPEALDRPYRSLEELPRALWLQATVNSRGFPAHRLPDLLEWRRWLGEGGVPPAESAWPYEPARSAFVEAIANLDLPACCRGDLSVAEEALQVLLWHVDRIVDYQEAMSEAQAVNQAVEAFVSDWSAFGQDIEAVRSVFDGLGDLLKLQNWAEVRGLLRSSAWAELLRMREVIAALPELAALIRRLGRFSETDQVVEDAPPIESDRETDGLAWLLRERRFPGMVAETRGVRRGAGLARLLPAELVLLRLPRMRKVWYARLVEGALLGYEDAEVCLEREPVVCTTRSRHRERRLQSRREMGPMVLCVDTSASMCGGAEEVAKAVVLEAMRTAAGQGRRCLVFAFGGPGEVIEQELSFDAAGLRSVLDFMGLAFRGGTDIEDPLERALERIGSSAWRNADLVLATDGEFGATPALEARLVETKQRLGMRVQGVLVGDRETLGLLALCDDIYWVKEWRRFGGVSGESPVHDKSLTAQYFPGAVRR